MTEKKDTPSVKTEAPDAADTETLGLAETMALDPFDPEALRLSQDFAQLADVKPILATVPVRKPGRHDYVRTHPSSDYQLTTAILQLKEENEDYLVAPKIRHELFGEVVPVTLYTTINRQGVVSLWPCRIPDETGQSNAWWDSAFQAAEMAREKWVRITSDKSLGAYRIYVAGGQLPEPEWPKESLGELLKIAFKNRYIDSIDHPVLKRLRGEV